jgi:hypothetical protein
MVPLVKDVATGIATGAAWTASGVASSALVWNVRTLYYNRFVENNTAGRQSLFRAYSDSYATICLRTGAGFGVLHGLKYMGLDESYLQGAAAIGGALIALKQAYRLVRPMAPQSWHDALFGAVIW